MKRKRQRLLIPILVIMMVVGLLAALGVTAAAKMGVSYLDADGVEQVCTDFTAVDSSTTTWGDGWYVVDTSGNGYMSMSGGVTVTGDAKLILCDDAYIGIWNGKNITVADGASLTVYGQAKGSGMLEVVNGYDNGNMTDINGSITFNGGNVYLTHYGATAVLGEVTVNGGTLYIETGNGNNAVVGDVTVNGGEAYIRAYGGSDAIAIVGNVEISDGYLYAYSSYGVGVKGDVTVKGGSLQARGGDEKYSIDGNVVVVAGKLSATTSSSRAISGTVQSKMQGSAWTKDDVKVEIDVSEATTLEYPDVQIPTLYYLYVGGTEVTIFNYKDVFGDGTVAFDPKTSTLTLNNYTYSGAGTIHKGSGGWQLSSSGDINNKYASAIYYYGSDPLTITLKGENSLTASAEVGYNCGIYTNSSITFNGVGRLTVTGGSDALRSSYGIYLDNYYTGKIIFEDACTVTAISGDIDDKNYSYSFGIYSGQIILNDATVNAYAGSAYYQSSGVCAYAVVNEGTLRASSKTNQYSAYAINGNVKVAEGGTIKESDESFDNVELVEFYNYKKYVVINVEPAPAGTVKLSDYKANITDGDDSEAKAVTVKVRRLTDVINYVTWSIPESQQKYVALYSDAACTKPLDKIVKSGTTVYIKGLMPGEASITFTNAKNGEFSATCVVTVLDSNLVLTVNDGTDTSSRVPVYGWYADAYLNSQFVIRASDLNDSVKGTVLGQLRFYASSHANEKWSGTFEVYVGSYDGDTISEFYDVSAHTLVYTGKLDGTGDVMDIIFDNDFVYEGGNLLVTIREVETGSYSMISWYGVGREGASVQNYSSSSVDDIKPQQINFAPKVTLYFQNSHTHDFTYTVDGATVTAVCNGSGDCDVTEGLTITILAPENLTYDGTVKTATLSTGYDATLFPGVYEIVYYKDGRAISAKNVKDAGTYTAKVTVGDVTAVLNFTIEKADPKYTVPTGITAEYGDTLADVTLPKGWKWKNPDTNVGKVGVHSFVATFTPVLKANYNTVTNISIPVTVEKATPTYTVPTGLTAKYGDTLADVTLPSGWAWADSTQSVGNAGTNTFKATYTPADAVNYNVVENVDVNVAVGKKTVTVTADNQTKVYGSADPEFTYTVDGLIGGDALTGELAREAGENVGTYAVVVGTLSAGDNYEISLTGATLTVSAKRVKIVANDQRKAAGSADPEFTYTVDGLVSGDALTGALAREAGENVGTYAIGVGTLSAGDNYDVDFTGATLTIFSNGADISVNVGDNTPKTEVDVNEGIVNNLLTEEEKKALAEGQQVSVYLEVVAVDDNTVPGDDKAKIEEAARKSGMTVGMYLDLSLLKKVGENNAVSIHDTNGNMIKVTVTVPEELRSTDSSKTRTFYVVRVHDGETTVLGEATGDTVTFETDKFSTYALTYKDATEGGTFAWWWILIAVVVLACVCVVVVIVLKKKGGKKGN